MSVEVFQVQEALPAEHCPTDVIRMHWDLLAAVAEFRLYRIFILPDQISLIRGEGLALIGRDGPIVLGLTFGVR